MSPHEPEQTPQSAGSSLWPAGFALAVLVLLVGVVVDWRVLVPLGLALAIVFGFLWASNARREIRGEAAPATEKPRPPHFPPESESNRYPRRVFLEGATLGIGGLIGAIVTLPALGFAILPSFTRHRRHQVDVGPLSAYPEGQWRLVTFLSDPAAGDVSRWTIFVRNDGLHKGSPAFTIISNHCAHLGCPVEPLGLVQENLTAQQPARVLGEPNAPNGGRFDATVVPIQSLSGFQCPCHGGNYDAEGNRRAGPPVRALDRFDFSIVNGHLLLDKPYSVGKVVGTGADAVIYKYAYRSPGQPVSGWEQWLYKLQPPR
ncbi:MAG: QcrA and Rieske domain-containing protein [Gaiellaceae bacterium]